MLRSLNDNAFGITKLKIRQQWDGTEILARFLLTETPRQYGNSPSYILISTSNCINTLL